MIFRLGYQLRREPTAGLERLQSEGIITQVNHSDYAMPVVPVIKREGSVRLCGDFKITLNKVLKIDDHPIPNIDYLITKLEVR